MTVLDGVLLSPLGLLALLAAVPLVLLYLIRPDPRELDLPTMRFLRDERGEDASSPVVERLSRSLLLFVQLAVLVPLAVSLATPYTLVSEASTVEERYRRLRAEHALVDTGDDFFDSFGDVWVG